LYNLTISDKGLLEPIVMKVTRWVLRREGGGDSSDLSYGWFNVFLLHFYYLLLTRFFKNSKINAGEFVSVGVILSYFLWNVSLKQVMWHFFDINDKCDSCVIIREVLHVLFEDAVSEYFHCKPIDGICRICDFSFQFCKTVSTSTLPQTIF
jgi:hypothetical protein